MNNYVDKKISIIMGIYNCEKTLKEAIDSILNQSYKNWELILCDDGSRDNTYNIAQVYENKYDNIVLLKNDKNMGLNFTLNKCLKCVSGDYVARMDADDISLNLRLEKEIEFLENNLEYSIVSTPMIYFDEKGEFGVSKGGYEPLLKNIVKGSPFAHATVMVRKKAYDAVQGYTVSDKFLRVEDWHLWMKMYKKGFRGYILDKPLYKMRDDRDAISRRKFRYRFNEFRVSRLCVKELNLPKYMYFFCLRPIIIGLIPSFIYKALHKKKLKNDCIRK